MSNLQKKIIDIALGENGLPVQARLGNDPGYQYFEDLKTDLRDLFELIGGEANISKELALALYYIAHIPYNEYSYWRSKGRTYREDLFDPQLLQIEFAVESILSGEWRSFFESE